jgi:hypothetical protein
MCAPANLSLSAMEHRIVRFPQACDA